MRLIAVFIVFYGFVFIGQAQETTLYTNINEQFYLLQENSFTKVNNDNRRLSGFESNGFDVFTSADVSNSHYLAIFSFTSQKIWLLDNELATLDEIRLTSKFDKRISRFFMMNQSLYLYSEEGREWYIYDIFTNQVIFQKELNSNIEEVVSFMGCHGKVYFQSARSIWFSDEYSDWEKVSLTASKEKESNCEVANCAFILEVDMVPVIADINCGSYVPIGDFYRNKSITLFGDDLFYLDEQEIHSVKVKLVK